MIRRCIWSRRYLGEQRKRDTKGLWKRKLGSAQEGFVCPARELGLFLSSPTQDPVYVIHVAGCTVLREAGAIPARMKLTVNGRSEH